MRWPKRSGAFVCTQGCEDGPQGRKGGGGPEPLCTRVCGRQVEEGRCLHVRSLVPRCAHVHSIGHALLLHGQGGPPSVIATALQLSQLDGAGGNLGGLDGEDEEEARESGDGDGNTRWSNGGLNLWKSKLTRPVFTCADGGGVGEDAAPSGFYRLAIGPSGVLVAAAG